MDAPLSYKLKRQMKVLRLTLKKKWFDMIASGEKKEEYRAIKEYWIRRLVETMRSVYDIRDDSFMWKFTGPYILNEAVHYDIVEFRNGYRRDSPIVKFKVNDITVDAGKSDWGAEPGKKYFVIKLGERIS
jgi:Txe/YoeB family toxin of Txe-Axe toxin-antitoxin module